MVIFIQPSIKRCENCQSSSASRRLPRHSSPASRLTRWGLRSMRFSLRGTCAKHGGKCTLLLYIVFVVGSPGYENPVAALCHIIFCVCVFNRCRYIYLGLSRRCCHGGTAANSVAIATESGGRSWRSANRSAAILAQVAQVRAACLILGSSGVPFRAWVHWSPLPFRALPCSALGGAP